VRCGFGSSVGVQMARSHIDLEATNCDDSFLDLGVHTARVFGDVRVGPLISTAAMRSGGLDGQA